jgi:hypothetical protein
MCSLPGVAVLNYHEQLWRLDIQRKLPAGVVASGASEGESDPDLVRSSLLVVSGILDVA